MLKSLTIVLYVYVLTSYGTKVLGLVEKADKDIIVVKNLRKQLMQENYDYSLESNETQTVNMRAGLKLPKNESKDKFNQIFSFNHTSKRQVLRSQSVTVNFGYFTISNVTDDSQMSYEKEVDKKYKRPLEQPIYMKDLLYYMDDEKLLKNKLGPETREINSRRSMDRKKYKMLKIRHQNRRSNPARFIQEEGNNGVVIINLDNGTFPEFRLPRSRRQYMHDHGEVVLEEKEIPPPPVSS